MCNRLVDSGQNYTDVCEEQRELRVIVLGSEMAVERYSVLIRDGLKRNISAFSILSDLLLFSYLYIDIYVFSFLYCYYYAIVHSNYESNRS